MKRLKKINGHRYLLMPFSNVRNRVPAIYGEGVEIQMTLDVIFLHLLRAAYGRFICYSV